MAGYGTIKTGMNPNKPVKKRTPEQDEAIRRRMQKVAPVKKDDKEREDRVRKNKQVGY